MNKNVKAIIATPPVLLLGVGGLAVSLVSASVLIVSDIVGMTIGKGAVKALNADKKLVDGLIAWVGK